VKDENGYEWRQGDECYLRGRVLDWGDDKDEAQYILFATGTPGTSRGFPVNPEGLTRPLGWIPPRIDEPFFAGAIVTDPQGRSYVRVRPIGAVHWRCLIDSPGRYSWIDWLDIIDPVLVFAGIK